jgi:hypothetical protein
VPQVASIEAEPPWVSGKKPTGRLSEKGTPYRRNDPPLVADVRLAVPFATAEPTETKGDRDH